MSNEEAEATCATYKGKGSCYVFAKLMAKGNVPFKVAALPAAIDYQYVIHLIHTRRTSYISR